MTNKLSTRLLNLYATLGSWSKVANEFGISKAMAWRIAYQDYEPKDNEIRRKLGLPEIIHQMVYRDKLGKFTKGVNHE